MATAGRDRPGRGQARREPEGARCPPRTSPADLDARFLRGRVHLARRETTLPIQEFQTVLKAELRLAPARHQLALAQLQAGKVQQAKAELKEAIALAPNFAEAVLLLAEVNMQSGAIQPSGIWSD